MNDTQKHGDFRFLIGFFIGGLIGAVIIFFLGTKEGKKTGKILEDKGRDLLDDIKTRIDEIEEKGKELKETVAERIEEKKDDLTQAAGENLDSALAKLEELQENSLKSTAALRKRIFKNLPSRKK